MPAISRTLFTESAWAAFLATSLDADVRCRFEALAIWEMKLGVKIGDTRLVVIGDNALEFTFGEAHDGWQVTDVRLADKDEPPAQPGGKAGDSAGPTIV
jgi:hypothetical protein